MIVSLFICSFQANSKLDIEKKENFRYHFLPRDFPARGIFP